MMRSNLINVVIKLTVNGCCGLFSCDISFCICFHVVSTITNPLYAEETSEEVEEAAEEEEEAEVEEEEEAAEEQAEADFPGP